ncbi:MAG: RING finger domain-containing protein [bacterium]
MTALPANWEPKFGCEEEIREDSFYTAVVNEITYLLSLGREKLPVLNSNINKPKNIVKDVVIENETVNLVEVDKGDACTICFNEFQDGENVCRLNCGHIFCGGNCIHDWLKRNNSCPLCRRLNAEISNVVVQVKSN